MNIINDVTTYFNDNFLNIAFSVMYALIYLILGLIVIKLYNRLIIRLLKLKTAEKRRATIGNVILSVGRYVIWFVMLLLILESFGVETTPILAGAGMLGLAVGLGAQRLVSDFISGFFILFEESFSIGEVVEIDGFKGEVIDIGLRTTKLKNWKGDMKIINNGDIHTLINASRFNSVAVVNLNVAYETDLGKLNVILVDYFKDLKMVNVIATPKFIGVTAFNASDIECRIIAECNPNTQYQIERDLRRDLKALLEENNIEIPFPQVVVSNK